MVSLAIPDLTKTSLDPRWLLGFKVVKKFGEHTFMLQKGTHIEVANVEQLRRE
jgi:hypothetical protein